MNSPGQQLQLLQQQQQAETMAMAAVAATTTTSPSPAPAPAQRKSRKKSWYDFYQQLLVYKVSLRSTGKLDKPSSFFHLAHTRPSLPLGII
jgi:hypothetical protein